jgi:hypothetical protein
MHQFNYVWKVVLRKHRPTYRNVDLIEHLTLPCDRISGIIRLAGQLQRGKNVSRKIPARGSKINYTSFDQILRPDFRISADVWYTLSSASLQDEIRQRKAQMG